MKVEVLFFSVLRDIAGAGAVALELEAGTDVAGLLAEIYRRWPAMKAWDQSLLVAVDQCYAKRDQPLRQNAEVAVMPPVQGG